MSQYRVILDYNQDLDLGWNFRENLNSLLKQKTILIILLWGICDGSVADAHRIIKLIQRIHAISVFTGYIVLGKFSHISCDHFNHKVYTLLDRVRDMEPTFTSWKTPKIHLIHTMKNWGICDWWLWCFSAKCDLLAVRVWTALTARPQTNFAWFYNATGNGNERTSCRH